MVLGVRSAENSIRVNVALPRKTDRACGEHSARTIDVSLASVLASDLVLTRGALSNISR